MPLFCSVELAARIERAAASLTAGGAAARASAGGESVVVLPVGGGTATWVAPGSPLNKVAGVGFTGLPSRDELAVVERAFAERDATVQVELSSLAGSGVAALFAERGYRLAGFENVLGIALPATSGAAPPDVVVSECAPGEFDAWLDALALGFAAPDDQGVASDEEFPRDVIEQALRDLTAGSAFTRFVARRGGDVAGAASLALDDGVAQLSGAATRPEHRRRGVQSALLAARLAYAARAGCDVAVITTQPGSKSQENAQKQGFALLYARAILRR